MTDSDEIIWMHPLAALNRIAGGVGDAESARKLLASRLRDDQLRSYADQVVHTRINGKPSELVYSGRELPLGFWAQSGSWPSDVQRWQWETGDFTITPSRFLLGERLNAYGVMFDAKQVHQIAPMGAALHDRLESRGGRPRDERWNAWIAEVALFVHEEGIDESLTPGRLIQKINDRLATKGIDEFAKSTVASAARAVVTALRSLK